MPPAIANRVRSRPPSLPNHHLTPVIPPRRRRQDFQDQVRAVPRGRVRRRSQAGASDSRNARTRRFARSPSRSPAAPTAPSGKYPKPSASPKRDICPGENHVASTDRVPSSRSNRTGPQPRRSLRSLRHHRGLRLLRRQQEQGRRARRPLRLPPQPKKYIPHQDGSRPWPQDRADLIAYSRLRANICTRGGGGSVVERHIRHEAVSSPAWVDFFAFCLYLFG